MIKTFPYLISKEIAGKILSRKIGMNADFPASFSLEEILLPFYSAEIKKLKAHYAVKYQKDKLLHIKKGVICIPIYHQNSKHTQIYADFSYPRKYVEDALQTDILPQIQYNKNFADIHQHNIKLSYAIKKMFDNIEKIERTKILGNTIELIGVDNVSELSLSFDIKNSDFEIHKYYIPSYVYVFVHRNSLPSYHFINGYNGKYSGSFVNSIGSYFPTTFLGIIPLYFNSIYYSLFPLIVLNSIVYARNKYKIFSQSSDDENTKKHEFHENYNFNDDDLYSLFKSDNNIFELYPEECKILEITDNDIISDEFLKNQKNKLLKMYHPDLYGEKGAEMTIEIMKAYSKLSKSI